MASTLPQREQNSFKALFKFYENKQYKKGLKTANEILKKFPEHGETLCMKGLILSYLNKKEEAYEFVRLGLKKDLKSHVCWHIYGLLYRADRNYEEAIKCYRNALRIDKDNFQILKDLAVLEVQTRNMDGFIETRQQLLTSKSQQKGSWVGLAVAYHIAGNYDMAIKVMDMYESTQQPPNPMVYDFEVSELVLYKNSLYEESGQYQAGLNHLLANEKVVFDTLALKETHVRYLIKLDRLKEAAELQLSLINGNPENQKYYPVYEQAKGIQATDIDARIALLKEISAAYPKANTPKRLLLDLLAGDELKSSIDKYLRSFLSKGAPSLFVTVKPVYKRDGVAATVTTLLDGYLKNLALSPSKFTAEDAETQSPTTFLWTLYYAAQHYAFLGNHALALTLIDQAINHTPTVVEIVQGKAKILKMAGDIEGAAKTSNEARLLDLQDRFINTKATKYLLRNDQVSNADEVVGLFAKGDQTTQTNNLAEMQASWYAIEAGKSFARQKQFGKALKKFHDVQKFFQDYVDDQFDFHSYSLRKMTLRSYIRMVRVEDTIHSHHYYVDAAKAAIEIYIALYDKPKTTVVGGQEIDLESLSEAEKKKALSKLKKQQAIAAATQKETAAASAEVKKAAAAAATAKETDGQKFVETTDPLGEAIKFLQPLQTQVPHLIDTHLLAFEIYIRRGKLLLALNAIKKAIAIDANHPVVHKDIVRFHVALQARKDLNETLKKVLVDESAGLLQGSTPQQYVADVLLKKNPQSLAHAIAAAEATVSVNAEAKAEAIKYITAFKAEQLTLKQAIKVHAALQAIAGESSATAQDFKAQAHKHFSLATYFKPAKSS